MMGKSKKLLSSRIPKNKKQYWRKGTRIEDVDDFLNKQRIDEREGGLLHERPNKELFTIDRTPQTVVDSEKLTRRQESVLRKRKLLAELRDGEGLKDVKPSKRSLRRKKDLRRTTVKGEHTRSALTCIDRAQATAPAQHYDLWAADGEKDSLTPWEDHFLKTTKRKGPKEPATLKHIPSLIPSVEVVADGASYNPSLTGYQKYVGDIADDEMRLERSEEKVKKDLALAPGESFVTSEEVFAEESAGLFEDEGEGECDTEGGGDEEMCSSRVSKNEPKTRKARRREALERKNKMASIASKNLNDQMHLIYSVRKISKSIEKEIAEREEIAKTRRKKKALRRLLKTQQLGRGKFEDADKDFLLSEELPGSLRLLKPQGDILLDRLKSLQKRNMLPVGGDKLSRSKLKKKLKMKEVEKRSFKEVTVGSRVI